ncbi:SsrA-binding protein SmpB [Riemerella anatipestifer]|nr:SsrA-binding protein SmpB [Riemerella anatipestifer]WPC12370.1 SsrA-binding protein SmpB [Riemerella anatipestifer]WPC15779.1 SsrA-binding protein SmpB [Riemerella anatipestifer]
MKIQRTVSISNKRARFEYEILEQIEAGIVLTGTEIKALRSSKASITESFCQFIEGELYIINMTIDEYKLGTFYNHKIKRERKLLLHKRELDKWSKKMKDVGNTIVPLKVYVNDRGKAKVLIALARGKKLYDKREAIKEREAKVKLNRVFKKTKKIAKILAVTKKYI